MENLKMSHPGGPGSGFHIEDSPDAVKVVALTGEMAKRVSHLVLHYLDLSFAADCVQALQEEQLEPHRTALWNAAIIRFFKCFGKSRSRFKLSEQAIFHGNALALENFSFFKQLRNKHLVHDENAYLQADVGAIINGEGAQTRVAKIITLWTAAGTLAEGNWNNLRLMIEVSMDWVDAEHDELCDRLTAILGNEAREELLSRPDLEWTKPTLEDIGRKRG